VTFVWMRTCPWCAKAIEKAYPEAAWTCACSWTDQNQPKGPSFIPSETPRDFNACGA
jgi:hypothetical protein